MYILNSLTLCSMESRAKSDRQENRHKKKRKRSHGEPPAEFGESTLATAALCEISLSKKNPQ